VTVATRTIQVQGTDIAVVSKESQDFISLTDMVKGFDGGNALIEQWLKNKDTVLFLAVWEQIHNPGFNSLEFEGIRIEAGRNSFYLSAKKWIDCTGAIGLSARAGRYGGTYAHKDIAFEFGRGSVPSSSSISSRSSTASRRRNPSRYRWNGASSEPWPR